MEDNNYLNTIDQWYDDFGDEIDHDTSLFYLIELFQKLKSIGFEEDHLEDYGNKIVYLLKIDIADDGVSLINERMIAQEIKYAFSVVYRDVTEIKETKEEIKDIEEVVDGDIYHNNTSEPDIDLRDIDLGPTQFDEDFIKELGIDNE